MADRVSQSVSKGLADLVLNDDDFLDQPTFQKAAHEGAGLVEVAKEADQETAGDSAGAENIGWVIGGDGLASPRKIGKDGQSERIEAPGPDGKPAAKVVIVGDAGTGKTCLLRRLCGEEFSGNSKATVGVDMHATELELPGKKTLKVQLWDTAGQEQFKALTTSYFRNAHAAVLVYDVTSPASFRSLKEWMMEVDRRAPAEVAKLVIGTKMDMGSAVPDADADAFAAKHGAASQRCSAKDTSDADLKAIFQLLATRVVSAGFNPDGKKDRGRLSVARGSGGKPNKKCC